jgi:hypothetical protein
MRSKDTTLDVFPARPPDAIPEVTSAQIATLVSVTADGTPEVEFGAGGPVIPARFAVPVTRERVDTAIAQRQQAVVLFENGDPARPLIVGFIETLQPEAPASAEAPAAQPETSPGSPVIEADVDGKRVRVTAQDEIVLQCGSASITLRRNGRVLIRGTYVETRSEGTNRIKGGQVQIN